MEIYLFFQSRNEQETSCLTGLVFCSQCLSLYFSN